MASFAVSISPFPPRDTLRLERVESAREPPSLKRSALQISPTTIGSFLFGEQFPVHYTPHEDNTLAYISVMAMKTYYLLPLCIQAGSARLYSILGVDTSDRNHINTSKAFASPAKLNAHLQAAIGEKISNKLPKIAENLNKCAMCDVIGEIA